MRIRRIGIGLLCSIFIVFGYSCKTYSYPKARLIIPSTRSIPETPPISTYGPQKEVEIAETIITPASVQPVEVTTAEDSQRVVYEVIVEEPRLSLPEEPMAVKLSGTAPTQTLPKLFGTIDPPMYLKTDIHQVKALLIRLPPIDSALLDTIVQQVEPYIDQCSADIVVIFGATKELEDLIIAKGVQGVAYANGTLALTCLPIKEINNNSLLLELVPEKTLAIALANLDDQHSIISALKQRDVELEQWEDEVKATSDDRLHQLEGIIGETKDVPALLFASLGEPSHLDWTGADKEVPYRSDYSWPLSTRIETLGFDDSYRITHYSVHSDPGTTVELILDDLTLNERVDYLYTRDIIPVSTEVIQLEDYSERKAVFGTFLIP